MSAHACVTGVLIECDPSIKSIIVNIDSDNHDYIIEDLDEERVVVKENMVAALKQKLEDVSDGLPGALHILQHPTLSLVAALIKSKNQIFQS
jgi:TFIIH basal transcription factor complex TTD-A subunit